MSHLETLVHDIGSRPAGSPANHRTETYIRQVFQKAGLSTMEICLDFPNWTAQESVLVENGNSLPLDVNPFSPGCDVTAPITAVSTLPELEDADLKNRIVLLYGELSKDPIFPINFAAVQFERDQTINRVLIEKAPAAVLAVNLHPWRRLHIFEDEDFPLPSATVSVDVGRTLLSQPGEAVHLQISTQTEPSHVTTLVGRTASTHKHRIVLCAHYDTKVGTPGASDNGASVAALLTLAQLLPQRNLPVGLEFIAWGDEEYGGHTDSAYVTRIGAGLGDILCVLNMDGIGLLTENTTITMLAQSKAFEQRVRQIVQRYPGVVWVDPWIQSNHATYAMRGVPSIALSSLTWERAHQADDTMDWISPAKVDEVMALVVDVITAVHDHSPSWSRE